MYWNLSLNLNHGKGVIVILPTEISAWWAAITTDPRDRTSSACNCQFAGSVVPDCHTLKLKWLPPELFEVTWNLKMYFTCSPRLILSCASVDSGVVEELEPIMSPCSV